MDEKKPVWKPTVGWFRAYIVFCVIWVICVTHTSIEEYPDSNAQIVSLASDSWKKLPDIHKEVLKLPVVGQSSDHIIGEVEASSDIPHGLKFNLKKDAPEASIKLAINAFTDLYISERGKMLRSRKIDFYIYLFLMGLGVPVFVYVSGKAIYWVYKGFTHKELPDDDDGVTA